MAINKKPESKSLVYLLDEARARYRKDPRMDCIIHLGRPSVCGCPDVISQSDFCRQEVVCAELPLLAMLGGEKSMKGPVTVIWEHNRSAPGSLLGEFLITQRAIEIRNSSEVRKIQRGHE